MKKYIRFEIVTEDRLGVTLDILKQFYKFDINIIALEVFSKKVFVKMQDAYTSKINFLINGLYKVKGIEKVNAIELLEYEKNEKKLLAIIDAVDDGIMYINRNSEIEIFNRYCEDAFKCKKEQVLGKKVNNIVKNESMIQLLNNGGRYDNIEMNLKNDKGNNKYLITGIPIKNDNNTTIGVVASIRDVKKAMELAKVVSNSDDGVFKDIIGSSPSMERVKEIIKAVSKNNSTIMLRGESGTGKELFAKAIHKFSHRKDKRFVPINCAAIPSNLIESELFGYEKGSFTGAIKSKDGLFKEANGGTLFLDEIGELPLLMQAKILRVLQESVVRRIGSNIEERVDVRIVCATNRNLEEMVKKGQFREDLYYRLNVIPIFIPPLREHIEDIPSLVTFFINKLNKKLNKHILGADIQFINKLLEYNWPGNIRELENIIERSMNLCNENFLKEEHFIIHFNKDSKLDENKDNTLIKFKTFDDNLKLKNIIEIYEKEAIIRALKKNKTFRKTAIALGVSHTTVINKVKKYGIEWKE